MADAKIVLPQMFQSGMVLQRGKPIPVWGKADPQEQVQYAGRRNNIPQQLTAKVAGALTCQRQKLAVPMF